MSDQTKATSGATSDTSGSDSGTTNNETYSKEFVTKVLTEKKNVAAENAALKARLAEQETEKLTKERDTLKAELEKARVDSAERTKRHAVEMAAKDAKFAKPAHYVHALIAAAGLKIEIGDDGEVTGIDAAIKKLQADMPELFEKPAETPPTKPKGTPPGQSARQTGANAGKPQPASTLRF
jgi:hypothetical protein